MIVKKSINQSSSMTSTTRKQDIFLVFITGQVCDIELPEADSIDCKYMYYAGNDWQQISGLDQATSQMNAPSRVEGMQGKFVLNVPLEATFKSSCPFGWPQLVLCCYGQDVFGKSIVQGYGSVHIPITHGQLVRVGQYSGNHTRRVSLFVPEPSSELQRISGWFTSRRPEFSDPRFVAQGDSRDITRVRSKGYCRVTFNVVTKGLKSLGYDNCARGVQTLSEFALQIPPDTLIEAAPQPSSQPATMSRADIKSPDDSMGVTSPPPIVESESEIEAGPSRSSTKLEPLHEEAGDHDSGGSA